VSGQHPLDHPIWTALTTRQASLAEGGNRARRFPPAIGPFAALKDSSPESFDELHALMAPTESAVLFTPDPITPPESFVVHMARMGTQMIGTPAPVSGPSPDLVTLGADDVPAMIELIEMTRPGPFGVRTRELGTFLGIKVDGRLVAITGERMKPGDYTELTAVCVHPDYRGRGYAQTLLAAVADQVVARGELPMLHVFSDNASAIALYQRQGMTIRRELHVTVLGKRA
jgi:ribosomal protein S18 acetylase RimI-like enzyme